MIEIFNMNQAEIDYELDRMYFSYMQERDLANRAIEDDLFNKEFDLIQSLREAATL